MNMIKQHRPAYMSGFEDAKIEFETVEELLEIDFVKNFSDQPEFYRFSFSQMDGDPYAGGLMCENNEGRSWWVVGYLIAPVELPDWKPVYAS